MLTEYNLNSLHASKLAPGEEKHQANESLLKPQTQFLSATHVHSIQPSDPSAIDFLIQLYPECV